MKKNWLSDSLDPGIIKKIIRVMRLTTILIFGIIFTVNASDTYSQSTRLNLQLKDYTVIDVFDYIEKNSEYIFLYKNEDLDVNKTMDVNLEDANINEILNTVLEGQNVDFDVYDRQVIIRKADNLDSNSTGLQQQKEISGVVTDESGFPLPGVTVVVQGTTIGTTTGGDGSFTLSIPASAENLQVSFVGMKTQVIPIGDQTNFAISLEEETLGLDEVVVVGYGTQISSQVTGSVQQMDADELEELPVAQVTQKLQGRMAGVQINQASGTPGQGMKVRIRGQASVNSGNDPLYVVDGFPIVGDISSINPDEIENISVLKDAASTSLYGSRAANGVILITTKSGKAGQSNFSFNAYYGVQEVPQNGRPDMMNATEFATFLKERYEDAAVRFPNGGYVVPDYLQNPSQYGVGTNWYDAMLQVAPIQNYNLTLSTANDKVRATGVLGYFSQDGVMKNSSFERYSMRLNSEFTVSDQIKVGINIAPNYSVRNSPNSDGAFFTGGVIYNAMLANPMVAYKNEDGTIPLLASFPGIGFASFPNPYRSLTDITNETKMLHLLANSFIEYSPIEGLTLKSTMNVDAASTSFLNFQPTTTSLQFWIGPPRTSQSTRWNQNYMTWLNENLATYTRDFGDHSLSLLGGFTVQKYESRREQVVAQEFSDDRIKALQTAATLVGGPGNTSTNIQEWSLISYLARLNYSYKGKYLLTAAIRRDGSSRFGVDNRWGNFPSVSVGWLASDEPFMENMDKISLLKLRASYGVVGNNNIGNYTQYANVTITNNVVWNGAVAQGAAIDGIANKDLGWETTKQVDLGLDLALFNNRLALTYDYYNKKTTNLLYNVDVPQESGFSNISANLGEFKFWGHEFTLESQNFVNEFRWSTQFNISFNRNEAVSLIPGVERLYGGFGDYATLTVPGQPIGQFWGLDWIGVYEDQADFDNSPKSSRSSVGSIKYRDVNDDGVITFGGDNDDRTFVGNPTPDFIYGITNTFSYKNFDLSIVCSGSQGNDVYVVLDQGAANLDGVFNVYKDVAYRWRPGDPGRGRYGASIPGVNAEDERDYGSNRFVDDGSYFAIKNLTLGYNLPIAGGTTLKSVRIYGSIQQVALFTNYRGVNPEVSTSTGGDTNVNALSLGFDYGAYPIPRTYTLGVNIGF